jgi:hypothetical protein
MSTFSKALEVAWKEAGIDVCRVRSVVGVSKMIAAQQMNFIGKVVRGPHDHPAQLTLVECYNNV